MLKSTGSSHNPPRLRKRYRDTKNKLNRYVDELESDQITLLEYVHLLGYCSVQLISPLVM